MLGISLLALALIGQDDLVPPLLGEGRLILAPPLVVGGEKKGTFRVKGGDNLTETLSAWSEANKGNLGAGDMLDIKGGVKQLLEARSADITQLAALRAEAAELDQKLAEVLAAHDALRLKTDQVTDRLGWPHSDRLVESIRPKYEQLVEREFHLSWYNSMVWSKTRWLGTITHQNPMDMWVMQEIMYQVQPEVVLEVGCRFGGSAVIWGMILHELNPLAKVVTVDVDEKSNAIGLSDDPHCQGMCTRARLTTSWKRMVHFEHGSSIDPAVVKRVADRYVGAGKVVMVLLDSDHTAPHVLQEMQLWGPLVSKGSYLIVQDSNVNGHPVLPNYGPGPFEAIEEYQRSHPGVFAIDAEREYLKFHMHKYLMKL
jgi:cephalosporin hydroxylase